MQVADFRVFTEPQQGATYEQLLAVAQRAETLGFGAFFRSDHYLAMGVDGRPGPSDAWITLAGLARETDSIRLGTLVTSATFRYPGPLAIAVAGVDRMSGGRVDFGIGAGWYADEHSAYAIAFPPTGERFDRLEETLAIVTGLWRTPEGETFDFDGTHFQVSDSPGLPKPVAPDGPPIVIGGKAGRARPGSGRSLRERVQRSVRLGRVHRHPVRAGPRGLRGGRARPVRVGVLQRAGDLRGPRRGRVPPAGRGDRPGRGRGPAYRAGQAPSIRPARRWPATPRPAASGSTCRCSISTTWTIWTCSPNWPAESHGPTLTPSVSRSC